MASFASNLWKFVQAQISASPETNESRIPSSNLPLAEGINKSQTQIYPIPPPPRRKMNEFLPWLTQPSIFRGKHVRFQREDLYLGKLDTLWYLKVPWELATGWKIRFLDGLVSSPHRNLQVIFVLRKGVFHHTHHIASTLPMTSIFWKSGHSPPQKKCFFPSEQGSFGF